MYCSRIQQAKHCHSWSTVASKTDQMQFFLPLTRIRLVLNGSSLPSGIRIGTFTTCMILPQASASCSTGSDKQHTCRGHCFPVTGWPSSHGVQADRRKPCHLSATAVSAGDGRPCTLLLAALHTSPQGRPVAGHHAASSTPPHVLYLQTGAVPQPYSQRPHLLQHMLCTYAFFCRLACCEQLVFQSVGCFLVGKLADFYFSICARL